MQHTEYLGDLRFINLAFSFWTDLFIKGHYRLKINENSFEM